MPAARPRTPSLPTCWTGSAIPTRRHSRDVQDNATGDFGVWVRDRKNRRQLPYRFERCGYVPVRNEAAKDGLWVIKRTRESRDGYGSTVTETARQVVYAKAEMSLADRLGAASRLAASGQFQKVK